VMADHRGLPLAITLLPGQASDKAAVADLPAAHPAPGGVVADRGHDARAIPGLIAVRGGRGHIPTQRDRKAQRPVDPNLCRQRNLVERFFNKLKHLRKIATRCGKSARNCLAAVLVACAGLWVRHHGPASLARPVPGRRCCTCMPATRTKAIHHPTPPVGRGFRIAGWTDAVVNMTTGGPAIMMPDRRLATPKTHAPEKRADRPGMLPRRSRVHGCAGRIP
ncbi:MAG: transposase, partial [Rhodobacter sp.]|nr:transposase [Rhodobacter sp.]